MTIGFETNNSATVFEAAVKQLATINPIDGPTRPPIGTLLMTIRSSELALSVIRTTKPKESA
jgi:hypothetical protein